MSAASAEGGVVVNEIRGWRLVPLYLVSWLLRLWQATLRFEILDQSVVRQVRDEPRHCIIATWHNTSFCSLLLHRRFRAGNHPLHGMVSTSRDGAWMAAFFRINGMTPVRGSSTRRGGLAAKALLKSLQTAGDVGLTVDGPRGPLYRAHPGIGLLARLSAAPILLFAPHYHAAWRLKSWDRFYIPAPFSRITVRAQLIERLPELPDSLDNQQSTQFIEDALRQLSAGIDPQHGL
jgi:lysophospholipid acyltransferase (LPLAT)-like uncharacterized protein